MTLELQFSSREMEWWLIMIVEVDGGYQVLSQTGKNLGGPYKTLEEAKTRLRQVEYFKHVKGSA